jgi:hypothetical protein
VHGDLVAFLDVNDIWPAGALLNPVRSWKLGGAAVLTGRAQVVNLDLTSGVEQPDGTPDTAFPHYIGAALFERAVFDRVGRFDPEMLFGENTDWFARLAETGETLRRIPAVTLTVRRHGQNTTEGRDLVQLHVVRAVKKTSDRQRVRDGDRHS